MLTAALGIPLTSYAEATKEEVKAIANTVPVTRSANVVKVGEYKSPQQIDPIARIEAHKVPTGVQAATLYVRNIPVITFLDTNPVTSNTTKVGETDTKLARDIVQTKEVALAPLAGASAQPSAGDNFAAANTAVSRATKLAAKLNQLSLNNVDASKITVEWAKGNPAPGKAEKTNTGDRYLIKANGEQLVEINNQTRLPDKTNDLAEDALQATNRLRRLLGNAPPLKEITGRPLVLPKPALQLPKLPKQVSLGPVRISLRGMASWYGPGFHGNRSASGERYNQNALTAAHRHLPFGTRVLVTNMRNGRSVVVKINDRGPFIRGRIIDLSAAAARVIGVMQSGVAPVRVDVLNNPKSRAAK